MPDYPLNQIEFEKRFSTEEKCETYLWGLRFSSGFCCKRCGSKKFWKKSRRRMTCTDCREELSVLSGTIFHKSHIPLTIWFRSCWWLTNQKQGVSALGLQRALGIGSYKTSWLMLQKLREAMVLPQREKLKHEVEVDEIYIGGPEVEGQKYRSSKRLILVAAEKNGNGIGRIRMKFIPDTSSQTLLGGVQEMVERGSNVETDAWRGYLCLSDNGYVHDRTEMATTRKGKRETNALPRVHRVASLFKRWLLGTYQGRVDPKHLPQYLEEFVFRFNRRTSKSRGLLFFRLLENTVQMKAKTYRMITEQTVSALA